MHDFVMKTLLGAVGSAPDYSVRNTALGWLEKGILGEQDLITIDKAIEKKNLVADATISDVDMQDVDENGTIEE